MSLKSRGVLEPEGSTAGGAAPPMLHHPSAESARGTSNREGSLGISQTNSENGKKSRKGKERVEITIFMPCRTLFTEM